MPGQVSRSEPWHQVWRGVKLQEWDEWGHSIGALVVGGYQALLTSPIYLFSHEIASLQYLVPLSEYVISALWTSGSVAALICDRGGCFELCFMHWGRSIRLQVESWPHVVKMGLFVIGVFLNVFSNSTWGNFLWPFWHDLGNCFLLRACEVATTLQTSEGSDAVNGAVRLEVYA